VSDRFDFRRNVRDALDENIDPRNRRRWLAGVLPALGLILGFGVVFAGASMVVGGAIVVGFGLATIPLMGRAAGPWRIIGAAVVYALAFALSHPLALITTPWPATFIAALVAGGAAFELTPRR
jgi:hypothetical protein